ncbi:MAG: hypothetical protein D6724_05820 [Armatimonadetes bacterium]|nr:MAG: hypothetical protein D6724_05820 [Armatimonadota bacterium]
MERWRSAYRVVVQHVKAGFGLSQSEAEDVAMDTILLILRKWGAEHVGDSALAKAVGERVAYHVLRRRRRELFLDDLSVGLSDRKGREVLDSARDVLRQTCEFAGIEEEEDCRLLELVLLEGVPYQELTSVFGVSAPALRQRVRRLRKRLREVLKRE